jgi:hypothetical protein
VIVAGSEPPARIVHGEPILESPERDFVPAEIVDHEGGYVTAIASASYILDASRELAAAYGRDERDVRRLVTLAHWADTSPRIDAFVSDDPLIGAEPRAFGHVRSTGEGAALLGLALRARGDYTIAFGTV